MHDGAMIRLKKLADDYDPSNRASALEYLELARARQEVITGLLYLNRDLPDFPYRSPDTSRQALTTIDFKKTSTPARKPWPNSSAV